MTHAHHRVRLRVAGLVLCTCLAPIRLRRIHQRRHLHHRYRRQRQRQPVREQGRRLPQRWTDQRQLRCRGDPGRHLRLPGHQPLRQRAAEQRHHRPSRIHRRRRRGPVRSRPRRRYRRPALRGRPRATGALRRHAQQWRRLQSLDHAQVRLHRQRQYLPDRATRKTDNFHVKLPAEEPETADISIYKFYDANANGEWDSDEMPLFGWLMTARRRRRRFCADAIARRHREHHRPGSDADLLGHRRPGRRHVASVRVHRQRRVHPDADQSGHGADAHRRRNHDRRVRQLLRLQERRQAEVLVDHCVRTDQGQRRRDDEPRVQRAQPAEPAVLRGGNWNLTTTLATPTQAQNWTTFVNWVNNASTTNMAYALSRQLAILRLNIDAGYVIGCELLQARERIDHGPVERSQRRAACRRQHADAATSTAPRRNSCSRGSPRSTAARSR